MEELRKWQYITEMVAFSVPHSDEFPRTHRFNRFRLFHLRHHKRALSRKILLTNERRRRKLSSRTWRPRRQFSGILESVRISIIAFSARESARVESSSIRGKTRGWIFRAREREKWADLPRTRGEWKAVLPSGNGFRRSCIETSDQFSEDCQEMHSPRKIWFISYLH